MDTRTALILGLLGALGVLVSIIVFFGSDPRAQTASRELILAETIVKSIEYGATVPDECPHVSQVSIPEHILVDERGQRRSEADVNEIFGQIFCTLDAASPGFVESTSAPELVQKLLSLYSGADVEFANGVIVSGSKPSVRAALFYVTMIGVTFSETFVLGDDQCQILRDWAKGGRTLEQRVLALATYMVLEGACIQQVPTGSTDSMLERVRDGNVDAAVQLIKYWNIDNLEGISRDVANRDESVIDEKIGRVGVMIETSREQYPLLAITATLEAVNLYGLKQYPQMLFR